MIYFGLIGLGICLGIGLAALGGGAGIGKAVSSALEGTARQPEAAGNLRTTLIIGAALIESLTIYALVIGILLLGKLPSTDKAVEIFKIVAGGQ
ncbi:MAG: ATP synthase F0 subunit C [Deltaproteobacteria bacterium]|nr:ATP synthase F0 subunit C [Deltaproteobacteria bacterium]